MTWCAALLVVLMAAPVCAEAPLRTIEVSMMFSICRDRIRTASSQGTKLTAKATLADFGLKAEDLNGTVTDASNYGMYVETVEPPVIVLVYRKRLEFQDPDRTARLSLDTWTLSEYEPRGVPGSAGKSIWRDAAHEHLEERLRYEERIRYEWLELLGAWPFVLIALLLTVFFVRGTHANFGDKVGAFLIVLGLALGAHVLVNTPPYHYGRESNALAYACVGSIALVAVGTLSIRPRSGQRMFLHLIAAAVLALTTGATVASEVRSGAVGLSSALIVFLALICFTLYRYKSAHAPQLSRVPE